jgi:hypothetical protein
MEPMALSKETSQPEFLVLSSKRSLPGCLQKYKEEMGKFPHL